MARRPKEHVIGDQAAAAVRAIWNEQGAAVDEIHKDYGEDLLVKTCIRGRVDPRPIWVQVKGTENETRKNPSVKLNVRQMIRWSRFGDLVLFILWDVSHNIGWYATLETRKFDHLKLLDSGKKEVRLTFSRDNKFDVAAADILAWNARIKASDRLIEHGCSCLTRAEEEGDDDLAERLNGEIILQVFDIMHDFGIMHASDRGFAFDTSFHSTLRETIESRIRTRREDDSHQDVVDLAIVSALSLSMSVPRETEIPFTLLYHMVRAVKKLKFGSIPGIWDDDLVQE